MSGSTFQSVASGIGTVLGQNDRSRSVNRSISQSGPAKKSPRFPHGNRCYCAPFFPRFPFTLPLFSKKKSIWSTQKIARFSLNFDRIALIPFFFSFLLSATIMGDEKYRCKKNIPRISFPLSVIYILLAL